MYPLRLCMSLFLSDLHLPFLQDLLYYIIDAGFGPEGFCEILGWRCLAFADGEEDVGNLEDIIEVCFYAGAVFENFVFVAGDFEAFLSFLKSYEGNVCQADLVGGLNECK